MAEEKPKLKVKLEYGAFNETLEGDPDSVFEGVVGFLKRVHPSLTVLMKLQLTVDIHRLLEALQGLVAFDQGLPILTVKGKMKIEDLIALLLAASSVGGQVGLRDRETLTLKELMALTGKARGTLTGAISDMNKEGPFVERAEGGGYRAASLCVKHVQENLIPQLKKTSETPPEDD